MAWAAQLSFQDVERILLASLSSSSDLGSPLWASGAVKPVRQAALVLIALGAASGRQMIDLLGAIATSAGERIRERIKEGLAEREQRGLLVANALGSCGSIALAQVSRSTQIWSPP